MRKISLIVVAVMLLSTGNILANDLEGLSPTKTLTTQISKLLSINTFTENEINATAQVRFTINQEQEIVVLSVKSNNSNIKSFVKSCLNYQKVDMVKFEEGKLYTIPIRIKK